MESHNYHRVELIVSIKSSGGTPGCRGTQAGSCWILGHKIGGRGNYFFTLCHQCDWISHRGRWEGGGEVKNSAS